MAEAIGRLRDALDREVSDAEAGVALLLIAVVVATWGALSIAAAYREAGRPDLPRWHPRRWVAPCFSWWLGWFLIVSDAGIYAVLGLRLLWSPAGLTLGWVAYVLLCGAIAAVAFASWARERIANGDGR